MDKLNDKVPEIQQDNDGWIRVEYKKNNKTIFIDEPKDTATSRKNKKKNERRKEQKKLKEEAKKNAKYIPPNRRKKQIE